MYAENGVEEYWLIDLRPREVTVFARSRAGASFNDAVNVVAGRVSSTLLPDLGLRVEELFASLA